MNRIIAAVVIAAVKSISAAVQAAGGFEGGNSLYASCASPTGTVKWSACLGYVEGIADAMGGNAINGYTACLPLQSGVTAGQIRDVVKQYLALHPEERHKGAVGMVAHALEDAFPCRR